MSSFINFFSKLFNNPPNVIYAIIAFLALFIAGLIWHGIARGAETDFAPYIQMSGGTAVVRGNAPALDITVTEPASQLKGTYWAESMTIVGSSTFNGKAAPNNLIVRGMFLDGFGHFDAGLGLSWMMNPAPYNGNPINFNLQVDYRLPKNLTVTYTHFSCAGMCAPNYGRDILLLGYRFH